LPVSEIGNDPVPRPANAPKVKPDREATKLDAAMLQKRRLSNFMLTKLSSIAYF
jgi:hypothetical protein